MKVNVRLQCLKESIAKAPVPPMLVPLGVTNNSLKEQAEELLRLHGVEGQILCVAPSGSRLYGTSGKLFPPKNSQISIVQDSSHDYIGIYVAPISKVVSMQRPPNRIDSYGIDSDQKVAFTRGMTLFEVSAAAEFICIGNHRIAEILYSEGQSSYETEAWKQLVQVFNLY